MAWWIDADALWHDMETADWYNNADRDEVAEPLVLRAPTVGGWISVKDRLPSEHDSLFANNPHLSKHMWAKESDDVIIYVVFPDGTGRATEGRLRDGKWNTKISQVLEPVITHWMPLPEPPKEVMLDGDQ